MVYHVVKDYLPDKQMNAHKYRLNALRLVLLILGSLKIIRVKTIQLVYLGKVILLLLAKILLWSSNKNSPSVNQQDVSKVVNHVAKDLQ